MDRLDLTEVATLIDFFRNFVDRCHHAEEVPNCLKKNLQLNFTIVRRGLVNQIWTPVLGSLRL